MAQAQTTKGATPVSQVPESGWPLPLSRSPAHLMNAPRKPFTGPDPAKPPSRPIRGRRPLGQDPGPFLFGAGLASSCETFLTEAEGVGLALPGVRPSILPRRSASRHGLGVAWTGVEDHLPEPPGFSRIAAFLGQNGEVPHGEMAVDALVDAIEGSGQSADSAGKKRRPSSRTAPNRRKARHRDETTSKRRAK